MSMFVGVQVRVRMCLAGGMNVAVAVNEIGLLEQGSLAQDLRGRSQGHYASRLKNKALVGNVSDDIEVVGRGDHRLCSPA